jgi:hypothetical protein
MTARFLALGSGSRITMYLSAEALPDGTVTVVMTDHEAPR